MNFLNFKITSPLEYDGGSKTNSLSIPYLKMVQVLGEPIKNTESGFPDDDYKVDVCWGFKSDKGVVSIWNYKNGPAYLGDEDVKLEDIDYFSVYVTDQELFQSIFDA